MGDRKAREQWETVAAVFGVIGVLCGLAVVGWQAYYWLRHSAWVPLSVVDGLRFIGVEWARSPRDWIGLWKVFDFLPLAVGVPAVGLLLASIAGAQADHHK